MYVVFLYVVCQGCEEAEKTQKALSRAALRDAGEPAPRVALHRCCTSKMSSFFHLYPRNLCLPSPAACTSLYFLLTCVFPCCPPRDPTYSTVQEQQTGFSTRFDDQHEFYVSIGDSPPKKSCRISLKHLKLDRCPICPRRRKPSHLQTSASLKLAIYLVIHR